MRSGYISVDHKIPRSYLFAVVANVGPGGASRTLSVAYRQHPEKYNALGSGTRVEHMVADTLALIAILSDSANRAPLETERPLAEDWYRRSHKPPIYERPSVLDISNLDSSVKYSIAVFNLCYIAYLQWYSDTGGWDSVEDPPPAQEPDVVLDSP